MKEQFVPYNLAVLLRDLGFDEECIFMIDSQKEGFSAHETLNNMRWVKNSYIPKHLHKSTVTTPLWQQAFDWFRKKHKLVHYIDRDGGLWVTTIKDFSLEDERSPKEIEMKRHGFNYYPSAQEACLEKLIEIVTKS